MNWAYIISPMVKLHEAKTPTSESISFLRPLKWVIELDPCFLVVWGFCEGVFYENVAWREVNYVFQELSKQKPMYVGNTI